MIQIQNKIGTITIQQEYFTSPIGSTVTGCFSFGQLTNRCAKQTILAALPFVKKKSYERGISVRAGHDKLVVDLHITVLYGVNVGTVVKSIINKVKYVMEESTGISVERVNVYVDEIKT